MVDEHYNDVEPGQEGEMLVRSPLVTQGYFNNPQATKDTFHDGWFCTGDIGVMRNGKFYIVDRKKVRIPPRAAAVFLPIITFFWSKIPMTKHCPAGTPQV